MNEYMKMLKQYEFRKQTEEAKFEAFSLMCKKVADLEKENAELQEENGKLLQRITQLEKDVTENESDCSMCDFPKLKQDLEKENAELKAQLQKKINTTTVSDYPYSALKLEEAKELIKEWLRLHNSNTKKTIIKKSENFLKESE